MTTIKARSDTVAVAPPAPPRPAGLNEAALRRRELGAFLRRVGRADEAESLLHVALDLATAKVESGQFEFTLAERKKQFEGNTENWGREPMRSIGRGHYGLGLNRIWMIVEAHDGKFSAQYDPTTAVLLSRIVLPLAKQP